MASNPLNNILVDPRIIDLFSKQPENIAKLVTSWMRICVRYLHPDVNPEFGEDPLKSVVNQFLEAYSTFSNRQLTAEQWRAFIQEFLDNPAERIDRIRLYHKYIEEINDLKRRNEHLINQVRQKEAEGIQKLTEAKIRWQKAEGTALNQVKLAQQIGGTSVAKLICLLVGEELPDKKRLLLGKYIPMRRAFGRLFVSPISYKIWDNILRETYGFPLVQEYIPRLPRNERQIIDPQRIYSIHQYLYQISDSGELRVKKVSLLYRNQKTGKAKAIRDITAACHKGMAKITTEPGALWYRRGHLIGTAAEASMQAIGIKSPGSVTMTPVKLNLFLAQYVQPYMSGSQATENNWLVAVKTEKYIDTINFLVYGFPVGGRYKPPRSSNKKKKSNPDPAA